MGNKFPHGVSEPLHIIIFKYDYMNDYMYNYMTRVTNSVWEFVSLAPSAVNIEFVRCNGQLPVSSACQFVRCNGQLPSAACQFCLPVREM